MAGIIKANLLRRWGRTALTGLGIAVGVTTVVALLAVTGGLSRSAGDLAHLGRADFGVFQAGLADLTASSLPDSVIRRIERVSGVAAASPVLIVANAIPSGSSILVFGAETSSFLTDRLVLVSAIQRPHGAQLFVGAPAPRASCTPRPAGRWSSPGGLSWWPVSTAPASHSRMPASCCLWRSP